jgi:hypothetical protein
MMSVGSQYSMKGPTIPVVVANRGAAARSGISRMVEVDIPEYHVTCSYSGHNVDMQHAGMRVRK